MQGTGHSKLGSTVVECVEGKTRMAQLFGGGGVTNPVAFAFWHTPEHSQSALVKLPDCQAASLASARRVLDRLCCVFVCVFVCVCVLCLCLCLRRLYLCRAGA
jgi:hypothetical protein